MKTNADNAVQTALCDALREVLAAADPPWAVAEAGEDVGARVDLVILSAGKQALQARLQWQAGGAAGESPDMGFDVVDRKLSRSMLPAFARQLLIGANWPG